MGSRQSRHQHLRTKGSSGADYDWRDTVHGQTGTLFTAGSWVVDDPDGLLSYERHGNQTNLTVGMSVLMHAVDLGYLVDEQEPAVGSEYNLFDGPQRYLKGRRINFELDGAEDIPSAQIDWDGTFGATSTGGEYRTWKVYLDPASSSDADYKTIIAEIANSVVAEEEILVCKYVLGIHSNVGPDSGFTSGHAWITYSDWTNGTNPTVTRVGLWPDEHPLTVDNGDGSDVRFGLEQSNLGAFNRFYLLSPSEFQNLTNYMGQSADWAYLNTCANWAEGAVQSAVGEEVDSSDSVLFGTPRKISESIISLEAEEPTTSLEPRDSGADIEQGSSTGNSTWSGTSFLD